MARQKRGTSSAKLSNTGFEQNMPQGNNWQELLNDSAYKYQLIEMIKQYLLEFGSVFFQDLLLIYLFQEKMKYMVFKLF